MQLSAKIVPQSSLKLRFCAFDISTEFNLCLRGSIPMFYVAQSRYERNSFSKVAHFPNQHAILSLSECSIYKWVLIVFNRLLWRKGLSRFPYELGKHGFMYRSGLTLKLRYALMSDFRRSVYVIRIDIRKRNTFRGSSVKALLCIGWAMPASYSWLNPKTSYSLRGFAVCQFNNVKNVNSFSVECQWL